MLPLISSRLFQFRSDTGLLDDLLISDIIGLKLKLAAKSVHFCQDDSRAARGG